MILTVMENLCAVVERKLKLVKILVVCPACVKLQTNPQPWSERALAEFEVTYAKCAELAWRFNSDQ